MSEIKKKYTTDLFQADFMVDEEQNAIRLDQFLGEYLVSFSRQQIKEKIKKGEIRIHNRPYPHKASAKVYTGEIITLQTHRGELEDEYWRGEKINLQLEPDIIFEDEKLIVISKPAYMCTHPTGKHLFNCATVFFETKYDHTIHSIHRIDRETSGALLLAKDPKTAQIYTTAFEEDKVEKCYFFMAHKNQGTSFPFTAKERLGGIDTFIPKLFVHCFEESSNQGKTAQTHFKLVHENDNYILGLAFPKTGRQHQIRSHAAFHGYPLVGDKLYNGDPLVFTRFKDGIATREDHDLMQLSRHALHATALSIPYNRERKVFRARVPNDFWPWLEKNFSDINEKDLNLKIDALIEDFFQMS